ncbi:hypothetical protein AXF42_Ash010755 [Apostasia shenzhenica]|uniref:Integrase catalytic domain-containing protein n=1 Tax=Apostasia shenzhenica TaxID=1088818 RepID=A0A2I0A0K6_9ASPA|nr:hypothetical protein AXF42_Ash010755 [Apostasia shenzhenica]
MSGDHPRAWLKWILLAQWWYNNAYHSTIKMSPYEASYGKSSPLYIPYIAVDSRVEMVDFRSLVAKEEMRRHLWDLLTETQNCMKQQAPDWGLGFC